jgi:hypothetical protein
MSASIINRRLSLFAVGLVLLAAAGCVRESDEQGTRVFQFALWVPVVIFLAGIAAAGIGFFVRKFHSRGGWALMIIGPFAALGIGPSMMFERAAVSKDGFDFRTGIYGQTVVPTVQFADLTEIRYTTQTRMTRRGRSTTHSLVCERKSGGPVTVPVNNPVATEAAKLVLKEAATRGVPIRNETGGD